MDFKVFGSVYLMVFLAELGDKTQIATFAAACSAQSGWSVFGGSAAALVTAAALATVCGVAVAQYVSPAMLNKTAGGVFLAFGLYYLMK
jgi:putative Ca2+/H+ antiporter (TMEM165/GDT1 family)